MLVYSKLILPAGSLDRRVLMACIGDNTLACLKVEDSKPYSNELRCSA